jgi:hypothetical protein
MVFVNRLILLALSLLAACAPAASPAATSSPTSAARPSSTLRPTWTPLPTLPAEEALKMVHELFTTNAGCRLPCWWGITPGVTTWEEARQFFAAFTTDIIQRDSVQITEKGITYVETGFGVRFAVEGVPSGGAVSLGVINSEISTIHLGKLPIQYTIPLHQFLEEYGPPTQIFMRTFANAPDLPLPFILILFYENQGIMAIYDYEAERVGDLLHSCPMPVGTILWLWSQEIEMDDEDIEFRVLGPDPSKPLRLLEEVTDYTTDSFYQTFKETDIETCIDTPVEHWE